MMRPLAAGVLLVRFAWQVVMAGITTAWIIVRPGARPQPALVRMSLGKVDATGAAVLASLVTLTPGTTAIDIDLGRRQLLLHVLDSHAAARTVAGIRRQFERYVEVLFPERPS
jgi:multisubunit Na+/H+ antiporter MnhE subunit